MVNRSSCTQNKFCVIGHAYATVDFQILVNKKPDEKQIWIKFQKSKITIDKA